MLQGAIGAFANSTDLVAEPKAANLFIAISDWIYKFAPRPDLGGWNAPGDGFIGHLDPGEVIIPPANDSASGLDCGAFYHAASGTLVIVCRGTEPNIQEWVLNFATIVTRTNPQLPLAVTFAAQAVVQAPRKVEVKAVVVTGHSLGGGLAQCQYACLNDELAFGGHPPVENLYGFTYAPAPFGPEILLLRLRDYNRTIPPNARAAYFARLKNWMRPNDPVGGLGKLIGRSPLGVTSSNMVRVWEVQRNPHFHQGRGQTQFLLREGAGPTHSSFLYYKLLDAPVSQHVVVNVQGKDTVHPGVKPAKMFFNRIPDAYL